VREAVEMARMRDLIIRQVVGSNPTRPTSLTSSYAGVTGFDHDFVTPLVTQVRCTLAS